MILFPHAKINIGLNILKIREDGYHEISSVFYPVKQCYDVLEITEQQHFSFVKSGIKIPDGENLCEKAFHLLKKDFSFANVEIHLYKHIPIGAGLGGGSADAALTLMGLNQLFELELNKTQLKKYALSLGADCPFFIDDRPTLVEGIGEKLSPIDLDLNGFEIKLINPAIHVSTKEAYAGITPLKPETSLRELIRTQIENWKGKINNDFEKSIFEKHPKLQSIKEQLYKDGAIYASMSGSGSTIYGFFEK
mgnify:CR=1 FL=1